MVQLKIIMIFYKSYFALTVIASLFCAYMFFRHGIKTVGGLFWLKVLSDAMVVFFIDQYKSKEFYYYRNLGLSKRMLWAVSLTADFLLFIILITLASLIKRCTH